MINHIRKQVGSRRIVAIGNPPYQENYENTVDNNGANPIYHLFLNALIEHSDIEQFLVVIPSKWFAGGRGKSLKSFAQKIRASKKIVQIHDFPDHREVFPTVDIKGGVCFLHWSSLHDDFATFVNRESNEESVVDLSEGNVIARDRTSRQIMEKVTLKADKFLSEIAWSWNPFNLSSNYFKKNEEDSNGDLLECFTVRKIIKKIRKAKITKNAQKITRYKVVCPKAVKSGGIPHSADQIFILNKNQICTETYMVLDSFEKKSDAEKFARYLQTDFVRFLVSLKKITHDVTRETWSLVPMSKELNDLTDEKLYEHFSISTEEKKYINEKIKKWSNGNIKLD